MLLSIFTYKLLCDSVSLREVVIIPRDSHVGELSVDIQAQSLQHHRQVPVQGLRLQDIVGLRAGGTDIAGPPVGRPVGGNPTAFSDNKREIKLTTDKVTSRRSVNKGEVHFKLSLKK